MYLCYTFFMEFKFPFRKKLETETASKFPVVEVFDQRFEITPSHFKDDAAYLGQKLSNSGTEFLTSCLDSARARVLQVGEKNNTGDGVVYEISSAVAEQMAELGVVTFIRDFYGDTLLKNAGMDTIFSKQRELCDTDQDLDRYEQKLKLVKGKLAAIFLGHMDKIDPNAHQAFLALQVDVLHALQKDDMIKIVN